MFRSRTDKSLRDAKLFGIFCLICGAMFSVFAIAIPAYAIRLPPFEAEWTKRAAFFGLALVVAAIGVGFLMRRQWGLRLFIAYILLGTAWHVAVGAFDAHERWLLYSPLFNLPVGFGIYWCVRGAFTPTALDSVAGDQ